ncbi:MAG TPA: hypothetical protein DD438_09220 [Verrucomicrobiales bacterium]|nr:hypothetical protein [Verrucomicrobiales bacterium]
MKTSMLIAVGALLFGGVGGYLVGSGSNEASPEGDGRVEVRTKKSASNRGAVAAVASGNDTPRATRSSGGLREILAEPGQTSRIMSLLEYYSDLDPSEFEGEVQKLQGLPMSQRMLAMNLLFSRWAENDPKGSWERSQQMGFPEMFMARAGAVSGWAASNPEALAQEYSKDPNEFGMGPGGRGRGDTAAMIAGEWAKQNPEGALKWAQTLDEREAADAISGIFNELSQQDPQEALRMAATLNDNDRGDAYESIAESWAISDYAAADRWINSLSSDEQGKVRFAAIESLANASPSQAAQETTKLPAGEERDELVAEVSREWARQDAPSAFEWLTESGSDNAVEEGIGRVVGALAREDPERVLDYIDSRDAGEVRDNAVQGYVYGNRGAPPAETIRLAETISGEDDRQRAVTRVAYEWAREDPEATLQYLETTDAIGEDSRKRISEMAERAAAGEEVGRGFRGPPGRR